MDSKVGLVMILVCEESEVGDFMRPWEEFSRGTCVNSEGRDRGC